MPSAEAIAHETALRERRENPPEPEPDVDPMVAARMVDQLFASWATDPGCTVTEVDAGGVRALWVDPPDGAPDAPVVLYFHGGAYILGTADHVTKYVGHLAVRAGCRVLSVDYRLGPEHAYPAAVDDALASYQWLLDQGTPAERIVISGDSAGGGLTLATLLAIRDRELPMPAAAMPISPWADLTCTADSWTSAADTDMLLQQENLANIAQLYTQGADLADPLVSPIHGDYRGLPPLYVQAAGAETLLDDCLAVVAAASRDGVAVAYDVSPGMQHVFQYCVGSMPEADAAVDRMAAFIDAVT